MDPDGLKTYKLCPYQLITYNIYIYIYKWGEMTSINSIKMAKNKMCVTVFHATYRGYFTPIYPGFV